MEFLFGLTSGGVCLCEFCYQSSGALLPHLLTLTPLRLRSEGRFNFCSTFRRIAPPGRYPAPSFHEARTFLTPRGAAVWSSGIGGNMGDVAEFCKLLGKRLIDHLITNN